MGDFDRGGGLKEVEARRSPRDRRRDLSSELGLTRPDDIEAIDLANTSSDVEVYSVISSHKIHKRVSTILRYLAGPTTGADPARSRVVVLRAKSHDAGKLISVAEIAKRELAKDGDNKGQWYQYIALGEVTVENLRKHENNTIVKETVIGNQAKELVDATEQDDFEVMKTPFERAIEGRPTLRTIPIMSLFLSRVSINPLKRQFGEQTNEDARG
jgi:hypothetical protein